MDFSCQLPIFGWIFPPNGRPAGSAARGAEERPGAAVRRAGAAGRQGDAAGAMWTNLAGEEWVIIEVYPLVIEHSY